MTAAAPFRVSFDDYLQREAGSEQKHEWCDGVVYAMPRGTPEHGRLTARIARALGNALEGECETYSSDTMLYVEAAKLSTYADVAIVCGALETKTVRNSGKSLGEAITNPAVIVEILSDSTERYDRDGKFQAYKQLSSLEAYVLVAQDRRCIEVYRRRDSEWTCETCESGEIVVHGAALKIEDVYG